jgi:hypothetical protein
VGEPERRGDERLLAMCALEDERDAPAASSRTALTAIERNFRWCSLTSSTTSA